MSSNTLLTNMDKWIKDFITGYNLPQDLPDKEYDIPLSLFGHQSPIHVMLKESFIKDDDDYEIDMDENKDERKSKIWLQDRLRMLECSDDDLELLERLHKEWYDHVDRTTQYYAKNPEEKELKQTRSYRPFRGVSRAKFRKKFTTKERRRLCYLNMKIDIPLAYFFGYNAITKLVEIRRLDLIPFWYNSNIHKNIVNAGYVDVLADIDNKRYTPNADMVVHIPSAFSLKKTRIKELLLQDKRSA